MQGTGRAGRGPGILLLMFFLILVSCIPSVPAITITDDAGTDVTFSAPPERIVSLSPATTEILAELGLLDRVVAVTDVCDFPPEVKNKTRVGAYAAISIENVAAVHPDIVIASDLTPRETITRLRESGLPVIVVAPRDAEQVIRDIRLLGNITGTGNRAEDLSQEISYRFARLSALHPADSRPAVAHVIWDRPLYISGNNTLQNDLLVRAGGTNAFAARNGWGTLPLEELLMADPDVILVNGGDGMDSSKKNAIFENFMTNPQYATLTAVRKNRVYVINADTISRPGPRIADAAEEIAQIIHANGTEPAFGPTSGLPASPVKSPGFVLWGAVPALLVGYAIRKLRGNS